MADPCPDCGSTEFDHVGYQGGYYGHYDGAVIERTDYWDQKGSLYTECRDCDEVLYKNPAYDVLKAFVEGGLTSRDPDDEYRT